MRLQLHLLSLRNSVTRVNGPATKSSIAHDVEFSARKQRDGGDRLRVRFKDGESLPYWEATHIKTKAAHIG